MFPDFYNSKSGLIYTREGNLLKAGDIEVPIIDGIPRFVPSGSYASLFGDQWKVYRKTQLDSHSGVPITANRLNRCLGDLKDRLTGKLVLEAGCGAGRFTEVLLEKGADLVSSDLSSAVEVNMENFPVSEHHLVIQADINDMPYKEESFDVVICLGVIQHTPQPDQTIANLFKMVKRGGSLIIDHYTYNRSNMCRLAYLHRLKLRKKSADYTIPATRKLVDKYLPLHKRFSGNRLLSMALNRVSPVISYYDAFPELNDQQQFEWALLDTHDSLTDWHKHFRSKKQIQTLLNNLGAKNIWCEYGGNGVEARCEKP